ncbi:MAG: PEP-CTERM sorting domain-containing protein, partial [Phycisphaerales bacterium]|nr:PEP-CTERM sorting domain-containing protein [Phycisphaerales bacterium]
PAPAESAINSFTYSMLDVPIVLAEGETYTLATYYATPNNWGFGMDPGPQAGFFVNSAINYIGAMISFDAPGLQMPTEGPFGPEAGYIFGPNFQFVVVPAPAPLALMAGGLLMGGRRRRRT